jgi:hypothetical protein
MLERGKRRYCRLGCKECRSFSWVPSAWSGGSWELWVIKICRSYYNLIQPLSLPFMKIPRKRGYGTKREFQVFVNKNKYKMQGPLSILKS